MTWIFITLLPYLKTLEKFIQLERSARTSWSALLKKIYLNSHLLKAKVDWVHFGFATQALGSETVAKAIGAKMAVSFRGFDINVYPLKNEGCYEKLWNNVDKVHSISEYLYRKAVSLGLSPEIPYAIITPAVDVGSLPIDITEPSEVLQLVTIARLHWIKGVDTAIAAMAVLKEQGVSFRYHIIGEGAVKDTERYTFQAYEEKLQDEVIFHGKLTHHETLKFLQRADIYIQPSLNEGFCNAVLEAQALGKIVIASDVGGLPENIEADKTGFLFQVGDAIALAKVILAIMTKSEETKHHISEQAKARVASKFSSAKQQQEFVSFYKETP